MSKVSRRNMIKTIGSTAVVSGVGNTPALAANPIIPPSTRYLQAYTHQYTYYPGDVVEIRFNMPTTAYIPWVTYDIDMSKPFTFAWTLTNIIDANTVIKSGNATLQTRYPIQQPEVDQAWPVSLQFTLPNDIEPGAYIVSPGVPIYVRRRLAANQTKPELLVVIPTNTSNAYSEFGGASTYTGSTNRGPTTRPSFRRPLGLDGREAFGDMIKWIEERFDADYVTDFEMHTEPNLLTGYKCVVLIGHNEYYTRQMYSALKTYRDTGGNIANLAGNSIWYIVTYVDNNTAMLSKTGDNYYFWQQGRSSRFILGNYFEDVGIMPKGFGSAYEIATIYNDHHWMHDGLGLKTGDTFGEIELAGSYEMDGVPLQFLSPTQPIVKPNSGIDPSYVCLAVSLCNRALPNNSKAKPGQNWTVGIFDVPGGGQVFNPATITWNKGFANFNNYTSPIPKMTGNFLRAVTNTQLIEFRAPNPVKQPSNPLANNGYVYIYLKRAELTGLPQRRMDGRLIITRDGMEWTETHVRLTFPSAQRAGVIPVYKHRALVQVPGTKNKIPKEVLSTSSTAAAGWQVSGPYAHVFQTSAAEPEKRSIYLYSDNRVPGVGERLSVRLNTQSGERVVTAPFAVF